MACKEVPGEIVQLFRENVPLTYGNDIVRRSRFFSREMGVRGIFWFAKGGMVVGGRAIFSLILICRFNKTDFSRGGRGSGLELICF